MKKYSDIMKPTKIGKENYIFGVLPTLNNKNYVFYATSKTSKEYYTIPTSISCFTVVKASDIIKYKNQLIKIIKQENKETK